MPPTRTTTAKPRFSCRMSSRTAAIGAAWVAMFCKATTSPCRTWVAIASSIDVTLSLANSHAP